MLSFKFEGLYTKLENPILSALILTIIVIIIVSLTVDKFTFSSLKYMILGTFISSFIIFWNNYTLLTKKYTEQLIDRNTESIMTKILDKK